MELRPVVGEAVCARLTDLKCFVLCVSMGGPHLHCLAKLPGEASARDFMGLAKKHAAFELKGRGWVGKVWGKRGKELRVRDREHQLNVYRYILRHADEGAWVWKWTP